MKRLISIVLTVVMIFSMVAMAIPASAETVTTESTDKALKFKSGLDNLWNTDKQMTVKPKTFEATIDVPAQVYDTYEGHLMAWKSVNNTTGHYMWIDLLRKDANNKDAGNKNLSIRFLAKNGTTEVTKVWYDALTSLVGQKAHIAIVIDTEAKLYINGELYTGGYFYGGAAKQESDIVDVYNTIDASKLPMFNLAGDDRKADAAFAKTNFDNYRYFKGGIYNACLFSDVRTDAEIAADKTAVDTATAGDLIAAYNTANMDATAREIADLTGNGYDLKRVFRGKSFTSGFDNLYSSNKQVSALPKTLEATIEVPTSTADGDQYWGDILAWTNDTTAKDGIVWDLREDTDTKQIETRFLSGANGTWKTIRFLGALEAYRGKKVHVAIVVEADTVRLYVNGVEFTGTTAGATKAEAAANYNAISLARLELPSIGGDFRLKIADSKWSVHHVDNYRWFRGKIFSAATFADVRTADEIAADVNTLPVQGTDNLLYSLDLADETDAGAIPDKSGNGYNMAKPQMWTDAEDKIPITDYSYSFAVVGDTQVITRDEMVQTDNKWYNEKYKGDLAKLYDWLVNNAESKNIQFAFHMGDVTDWNNSLEWNLAMENISKLTGVIPNNIARGNHDQGPTMASRYTTDVFKGTVVVGEEYGFFDGRGIANYQQNALNAYQTITVNGVMYLMLSLDLGPCAAVVEWANEVIAAHPYHNVIISTHSYLQGDYTTTNYAGYEHYPYMDGNKDCAANMYNPGGYYGPGGEYGVNWDFRLQQHKDGGEAYLYQDASYMLKNLVQKNDNISMVLCGHECSEYVKQISTTSEGGKNILQFLVDGQGVDDDGRLETQHAGLVAMFYFSEDGKKVTTEYYSTIRNQYLHDSKNVQTYDVNTVNVPAEVADYYAVMHSLDSARYSVAEWSAILAKINETKKIVTTTNDMSEVENATEALMAVVGYTDVPSKEAKLPAGQEPGDFDGDGKTDPDAIPISSVADLKGIVGKKGYLTQNIVIKPSDAMPNTDAHSALVVVPGWYGSNIYLDGAGYTIEFDKTVSSDTETAVALFNGGTKTINIKNLNITGVMNSTSTNTSHFAVLCKHGGSGYVENVVIDVDINVTNAGGAISGGWGKLDSSATLTMKDVHFTGTITVNCDLTSNYGGIGGLVGNVVSSAGNLTLENCSNTGSITFKGNPNGKGIGGLVGTNVTNKMLTIKGCSNSARITVDGKKVYVGGLVGYTNPNIAISNSSNSGDITYGNSTYALTGGTDFGGNLGGIVGKLEGGHNASLVAKITNCSNSGVLTSDGDSSVSVGGILGGTHKAYIDIDGCTNSGTIKGRNALVFGTYTNIHANYGGIIGTIGNEYSGGNGFRTAITNCSNSGKIYFYTYATEKSGNIYAGGIAGRAYAANDVYIADCTNSGDVETHNANTWASASGILGALVCYDGEWSWSKMDRGNIVITRCENSGNISSARWAAGMLAAGMQLYADDLNVSISYCVNSGTITAGVGSTFGDATAGGIVGILGVDRSNGRKQYSNLEIKYCVNEGNVTAGTSAGAAGGIVGYMNGDSLVGNTNDGTGVDSLDESKSVTFNGNTYGYYSQRTYLEQVGNTGIVTCQNTNGKVGQIAGIMNNKLYLFGTYAYGNAVLGDATSSNNQWIWGSAWYVQAANDAGSDKTVGPLKNYIELYKALIVIDGETFNENDYTVESWNAFQNSLTAAKAITCPLGSAMNDKTVAANIDTARAALVSTRAGLAAPDYSELQAAITLAGTKTENEFTTETWAILAEKLATANGVVGSMSQTEIDNATAELNAAINGLKAPDYRKLQAAVDNANGLNFNNYTLADEADIKTAIASAERFLTSRTQADINAALAALESVVNGKTELDRTILQSAIEEANALDESIFTTETWEALVEILTSAETTLNSRVQSEIDDAVEALKEATRALKTPDYTSVENAIAQANGLNENDYSVEDWNAISAAVATADNFRSRTQAEIEAAAAALNKVVAETAKLDRTKLQAAIDLANTKTETNFTTETWEALVEILTSAQTTLGSRVQTELDGATTELTEAINGLKAPNYAGLNSAIEQAELSLEENDYSAEDRDAILAAIETAKGYLNNRTQAQINAAVDALNELVDSKSGLVRAELNAAIAEANGLDENDWTVDSWNAFKEVLAQAEVVLKDSKDQDEIDAAAEALNAAIEDLVAPDRKALTNAIANANGLNFNNYTVEDEAAIKAAIEAAEEYLTSRVQDDIDAAVAALNAVVNGKNELDRSALNAAITLAGTKDKGKFTTETWAVLEEKLEAANAALASRVQADINAAAAALNAAITALEAPDYTALNDAIANANGLNFNDYTLANEATIKAAITAAERLLTSNTQADIDAAVATLNGVVADTEKLDRSVLNAAITLAGTKNEDEFTEATWEILEEKLAAANAALTIRVQSEINAAAAALNEAIDGLVAPDHSELLGAIMGANGLSWNEYTFADEAEIKAAIAEAEEYLTSRVQADIDAAVVALRDFVNGKQKLDRTELKAAIDAIDAYDSGRYTTDTWAALQAAVADANNKLTFSRDQAEINGAIDAIEAAIAALRAPSYSALNDAIANANKLVEANYSVTDWADIVAAIEAAKAKLTSTNQTEIDGAVSALAAVISGKKEIDRTALNAAILAAGDKAEKDYTAETWNEFIKALEGAEAKIASRDQAEINAAVKALNDAMAALKAPVASDNTNNGNTDDDSDTDKDDSNIIVEEPDENTDTSAPAESNKESDGEEKKSGCGSAIGAASVVALMVTVIGTAIVAKKED